MTEEEWLTSDRARDLLYYRWHNVDDRKKFLLALVCVGLDEISDPQAKAVVKAIEDFAEGRATVEDLAAAKRESERLQGEMKAGRFDGCRRVDLVRLAELADRQFVSILMDFASASTVREIFGNPFRRVTFSPDWRTDTALALARRMYDGPDFSAMPELADVLQNAGCDSTDILNHCRDAGSHVRGCWVVDLLLDK